MIVSEVDQAADLEIEENGDVGADGGSVSLEVMSCTPSRLWFRPRDLWQSGRTGRAGRD